jgi:hypothetical protein
MRGKGSEGSMEEGPLEMGISFPVPESVRGAVAGGDNGSYVSPPEGGARLCGFFSRRDAFAAFFLDALACVSLQAFE